MSAKAIIIGIDDYVQQPLRSAVNDAKGWYHALIAAGLADASEIELYTKPAIAESTAIATHKEIMHALYGVYTSGDVYERFYFIFSGHGLLAYSNSAQTRTRTALASPEMTDLSRDGSYLIDFNALFESMQQAGPKEQFYFVDACRDICYDKQPDIVGLGWTAAPALTQRSQRAIYAVSPLGIALSVPGELGVFSKAIIEALNDPLLALSFDPSTAKYVTTAESLLAYAQKKVEEQIRAIPFAARKYMLPTPLSSGSPPRPIKELIRPADVPFTVHIVPDSAATATTVLLEMSDQRLPADKCYPQRKNHDTIQLRPQFLNLTATSTVGSADPASCIVDLRYEREKTIRIGGPPVTPPPADLRPAVPELETQPDPGACGVEAHALEPDSKITLRSLESPYQEWTAYGGMSQPVSPGPYQIEFSFGPDIFCSGSLFVERDTKLIVSANADMTPLMQETLPPAGFGSSATIISESMGLLQASLQPTLLSTIGMKPFDVHDQLAEQFHWMARTPPEWYGNRPLSIVVALDGDEWREPVASILQGSSYEVLEDSGSANRRDLELVAGEGAPTPAGFERIRRSVTQAPQEPFSIRFSVPHFADIILASAAVPVHATVVSVLLRSDGTREVSQNLLRLPTPDNWNGPYGSNGLMSYGKVLRLSQLAQKLYQTGDLANAAILAVSGREEPSELGEALSQLLHGKWTDPLLGCMGYFATRRLKPDVFSLDEAAYNLRTYFPELPDAQVIGAINDWDGRSRNSGLDKFLEGRRLPILAESVFSVADYAATCGLADAPIVEIARSILPGQPWSLSLNRKLTEEKIYATARA